MTVRESPDEYRAVRTRLWAGSKERRSLAISPAGPVFLIHIPNSKPVTLSDSQPLLMRVRSVAALAECLDRSTVDRTSSAPAHV